MLIDDQELEHPLKKLIENEEEWDLAEHYVKEQEAREQKIKQKIRE